MTQLPQKKVPISQRKAKFSFAIASLFEGTQVITYFDAEGNPILKAKKKCKPISHSNQTTLL